MENNGYLAVENVIPRDIIEAEKKRLICHYVREDADLSTSVVPREHLVHARG